MITNSYFCQQLNIKMRLGERFANFANKVKTFGLKAGSTLMNVAPKVIKVGSFVSGALSHVPGFIGQAAGWVHRGLDAANRIIDTLPNSSFKNKLQDLSNKANDATNKTVDRITPAAQTAKVIGDTAGKVIEAVKPHII